MIWNHDITQAPRGTTVQIQRLVKDKVHNISEFRREFILAVHPDGAVVQSYWIPPKHTQSGALLEGNRWSGFNVGRDPIAWAEWPTYESPLVRSSADEQATLITHKHIFLEDVGSGV